MSKKIITALSAGLTLAVASGCGAKTEGPTENPPPPEPVKVDPQPTANPPPPEPTLPTWEEVVNPVGKDGMPEPQRTNPPIPVMQESADGRCWVTWHDPRQPPLLEGAPYDPATGSGTEIQCREEPSEAPADGVGTPTLE